MNDYTIQKGDCLWNIAKTQYNTKNSSEIAQIVNKLAKVNNISNPNLIYAGNTLELPDTDSIFGTAQSAQNNSGGDTFTSTATQAGLDNSDKYQKQIELYKNLNSWSSAVGGATEMYALQKMGNTKYNSDEEELAAFEQYYQEGATIADAKTGFQYYDGEIGDSIENKLLASKEIAQGHILSYDTDENHMIDKEEFINGSLAEYQEVYGEAFTADMLDDETNAQLENAFNFFDLNSDGNIDLGETMAYYTTMDAMDGKTDGIIKFSSMNTTSALSTQADKSSEKTELKDIMTGFYTKLKNFITGNGAQNQSATI
ncbi:MAG: LysM domain-containing protein [Candidatus Gastranaerophilales bacterium]|nr:LysM domain-containing protein [Candidatus Gastranaerophilales bacterium]